jgi:protein TonB
MSARANLEFKLKYRKYLDVALIVSLAVHLVAFVFLPKIEIKGTKTVIDEIQVIDIPPEVDIPPPPKEIARPKVPVESLDENVEEEETIEDTSFDPNNLPDAPPPPPGSGQEFYVFDKAPKPKKIVQPEYPTLAREAEIEGTIIVKITVDERGRVLTAIVIKSTAQGIFDEPALKAVRQWIFDPAEQSGNPVKATITVPLEFSLNR